MSWGVKSLFGITKSSDKIKTTFIRFLDNELNIDGFKKLYSEIIDNKKGRQTIFTAESDKVSVFAERIRYLLRDVRIHKVMITSVYQSMDPCNDIIPKIMELKRDPDLEDFGIIFDKSLEIEIEAANDYDRPKLLAVKECMGDQYKPENWGRVYRLGDFKEYETKVFTGGRRTRYRKRTSKARRSKTRRS